MTFASNILKVIERYLLFEDRMTFPVIRKTVALKSIPKEVTAILLKRNNELAIIMKNAIFFRGEVHEVFNAFDF